MRSSLVAVWVALWTGMWTGTWAPAHAADRPGLEQWLDGVVVVMAGPAWCSGVVVDDRGTVATAYHCVTGAPRARVRTRGGEEHRARVVASRPRFDVALLEVASLAGEVPPRPLREDPQDPLQVGEEVWALGHPYGTLADNSRNMAGLLQWSVSRGVVSAVGDRFFQTDVALNPGNSGGPLLDAEGRVVGIASRRLDADNLAFAARAEHLHEMFREPRHRRFLGGAWGIETGTANGLVGVYTSALGVGASVRLRELLVADLALYVPMGARWRALEQGEVWWTAARLALAPRLRVGNGRWSTALDLGIAGVVEQGMSVSEGEDGKLDFWYLEPSMLPAAYGRVGVGGAGFEALWIPEREAWVAGVEIELVGIAGVF